MPFVIYKMSYSKQNSDSIVAQITLELQAAHIYRWLAHHFNHPEVALPGFSKYFMTQAGEELHHADEFITYHQMRGGYYHIGSLETEFSTAGSPYDALVQAITLEKQVLDNLNQVHVSGDNQTQVFVEDYINHQTKAIAEVQTLITKAGRVVDNPTGTYLLDRELQ